MSGYPRTGRRLSVFNFFKRKSSPLEMNELNRPDSRDVIIAEMRGMLSEKSKIICDLESRLEAVKNGNYGYRHQHIEWLNKEVLRLSGLCRELSQNNEKLNYSNMEFDAKVQVLEAQLREANNKKCVKKRKK